jgi:hypothetical protein
MTSDGDNTEDPPTSAGMDAEDYPDTAAGTSHGAGDAETELVPPAIAEAPGHAWSNEEPVTEALSRPWRSVWALAGIGLLCAVIVAFAIFGVVAMVRESHRGGSRTAPTTTPGNSVPAPAAAASSPTAPAPPQPARPDDDEYVAMAISPAAINTPHTGGFGTAGTQDEANRIALSECRAGTGNDDCLPVNAGMYHGCVSFAIAHSRREWAGGSGADSDAARADARRRLPDADFVGVQCSDPPGIIRATESPTAPPPPAAALAPTGPSNDKQFIAMIHERGITTTNGSDAEIRAAHTTCGLMDQGQIVAQIVPEVQAQNPGMTAYGAQSFVDSAIAIYCPQYAP